MVLDTRDPNDFGIGHLIGSINIGFAGRYAEFAGGVIQPGARFVLVTDQGMEREPKIRLARIGYDNVVGHLADPLTGFADSPGEVERSPRLDVAELVDVLAEAAGLQLVDVRQPGETSSGVIDGAIEIPLTRLNERLAQLDASKRTIVYCAAGLLGGYGASTAAHEPAGS